MRFNPLALLVAALVIAAPLAGQTAVSPGQTVTASLRRGDARMEGAYYDAYVIRGRPGERVLVRMRSGDFAPFLRWGYENEERWLDVGFASDPGASPDSRIVVRLEDDGMLELRATAPDKGAVGEYELRLTPLAEPSAGRIRPGEKVVGRLDPADSEGLFGYEDHYVIQAPPGDIVTFYLKSDEFDTSMSFGLWREDVRLPAFDDDTGPGNGSRLTVTFAPSAAHRLVVHAVSPGKTGAYTLHVLAGAHREDTDWGADKSFTGPSMADAAMWADTTLLAGAMAWTDSVVATDTVAGTGAAADMVMTEESPEVDYQVLPVHADQLVHGLLGDDDPRDADGAWYREFTYTATAGERLRISVGSDHMDPRVLVGTRFDERFDAAAEDDNGGRGRNAELTWTFPHAGEYTLRVTTAIPGAAGPFILRVKSIR